MTRRNVIYNTNITLYKNLFYFEIPKFCHYTKSGLTGVSAYKNLPLKRSCLCSSVLKHVNTLLIFKQLAFTECPSNLFNARFAPSIDLKITNAASG